MAISWNCCGGQNCYIENGLVDLDIFAHCFGGKKRPSDIDGVVDAAGHFIAFEFKPWNAPPLPVHSRGQHLLFQHLVFESPRWTILVIRCKLAGRSRLVRDVEVFQHGGRHVERTEISFDQLCALLKQWNDEAEKRGKEQIIITPPHALQAAE